MIIGQVSSGPVDLFFLNIVSSKHVNKNIVKIDHNFLCSIHGNLVVYNILMILYKILSV